MSIHLEKSIRQLKKKILTLGTRVEESLRLAVESLENRDINMATEVIDGDNAIDEMLKASGAFHTASNSPVTEFQVRTLRCDAETMRAPSSATATASTQSV